MTDPVTSFSGEYAFLSNFAPSPIKHDHRTWVTAEHLFQAMKTDDIGERHRICMAETPGAAKRLGRSVTLRPDWEQRKRAVMLRVLLAKFSQNPELAGRLDATHGRALAEGNTWGDTYWGAVQMDRGAISPGAAVWAPSETDSDTRWFAGRNWLGRLLMMVREVMHEEGC